MLHSDLQDRNRVRGLSWLLLSLALFAAMDTTTKVLTQTYPVPQILALRYGVTIALIAGLLGPSEGKALFAVRRPWLVFVRSACFVAASLLVGFALARMPVAELTAITFSSPILVALAAGPLLGERIGAKVWAALTLGLLGMLLIAGPGTAIDPIGTLLAAAAAGLLAAYQILSRLLVPGERAGTMTFYAVLLGFACLAPGLVGGWDGPPPARADWLLFVSLGLYGGLGHFLFTSAHRHLRASVVAPLMYVELVWAGLFGWVAFGHVPRPAGLVGMAAIACAGLLVARSALRRPTSPAVEPAI